MTNDPINPLTHGTIRNVYPPPPQKKKKKKKKNYLQNLNSSNAAACTIPLTVDVEWGNYPQFLHISTILLRFINPTQRLIITQDMYIQAKPL